MLCIKPYFQATGSRKIVVPYDSLLSHLWKQKEIKFGEQPTIHILVGGKFNDIAKLVPKIGDKADNIIICVGVFNLPTYSSKEIIEQIKQLIKLLHKQYILICNFPYPPEFCENN